MDPKDHMDICNVMEQPTELEFEYTLSPLNVAIGAKPKNQSSGLGKSIRFNVAFFKEDEREKLNKLFHSIDARRSVMRLERKIDLDDVFINYPFLIGREKYVVSAIRHMVSQITEDVDIIWKGNTVSSRVIYSIGRCFQFIANFFTVLWEIIT